MTLSYYLMNKSLNLFIIFRSVKFPKPVIAVLMILSLCILDEAADAQKPKRDIYTIMSLDGKPQKIYVEDDYVNNIIRIKCLNDSLYIDDTYQLEGIPVVLDKNFLELKYAPRIGSNIRTRRVLILCVNKSKLFLALHITYFDSFELTEVYDRRADSLKLFNEKSLYEVKLNLIGQNKSNYKLTAFIHDMNSSKHDPSTNYNQDDKTILRYDTTSNIFYNDFKNVNDLPTRTVNSSFPIIKLGRREYYYIDDAWYEIGKDCDGNRIMIKYSVNSWNSEKKNF